MRSRPTPSFRLTSRSPWWHAVWALPSLTVGSWVLFYPHTTPVVVTQQTWQHIIEIERRVEEQDSEWCDLLPASAVLINRQPVAEPERRGPHGEVLTRDRCRFRHVTWRPYRAVMAEGQGPQLRWPKPVIDAKDGDALGSERLGERRRIYEVTLLDADERTWSCRLPLERWQILPVGTSFRIGVDKFGIANCSTTPAP